MKTIDQKTFEQLCREVRHEQTDAAQNSADPAERTHLLLFALLQRLCQYLQLNIEKQMADLNDKDGFALLQTLEEHMEPEFLYSSSIDRYLLAHG